MKKIRIIPRLDIKGQNVVKGVQTEGLRVVGTPQYLAKKYYEEQADEIIYTDIVASLYGRNIDYDLLKSVTKNISIPITVGGGLRSIYAIGNALGSGADKVAINTHAIKNPEFLEEAVKTFGSQCIVLSVQAKNVGENKWEAYTDGGRERTGIDAILWIKKALQLGVGEILLMSIDNDGTRKGYDIDLLKAVSEFCNVPIICHGGATSAEDISEAIKCGADAVSASTIFHFDDISIPNLKNELKKRNIHVR